MTRQGVRRAERCGPRVTRTSAAVQAAVQSPTAWVADKQQALEVQMRVPASLGSHEDPLLGCRPLTSFYGKREGALWGLFYKDTYPVHEGSAP